MVPTEGRVARPNGSGTATAVSPYLSENSSSFDSEANLQLLAVDFSLTAK